MHMINSTNEEKSSDKIYHTFKKKFPGRVEMEEIYVKILKAISKKHTAKTILHVENWQGN